MKIKIDPQSLSSYRDSLVPMTITVHKNGLFLNSKAVKLLEVKIGDSVTLEFEDSMMFLVKSPDGFRTSSEMKGGLLAMAPGLNRYIDTFIGKSYSSFKFRIGEFKDGRHMLSLIN